jgi:hypothetical protein
MMPKRNATLVALVIGLSAAAFASQALAQDAARDAAIHKCVNQAQKEWPNAGDDTTMRNRTAVYLACMSAAGQRP